MSNKHMNYKKTILYSNWELSMPITIEDGTVIGFIACMSDNDYSIAYAWILDSFCNDTLNPDYVFGVTYDELNDVLSVAMACGL